MKKIISIVLAFCLLITSCSIGLSSVFAITDIPTGTNVVGYYNTQSFFDSANFNYTAEQLATMAKHGGTPILLGTPDDLTTQYGSWSLTVDSTATALKGANYPQYMPRAVDGAMLLPMPISALAVRAIKGMKTDAEYTVSFKYKAIDSSAAGNSVEVIFANKFSDCQPQDTASKKVYTTNATTTSEQIASFDIVNTYNDASGFVYLAFDNNAKNIYIDDLSIIEKNKPASVPKGKNFIGYFNGTNGEGKESQNPYASAYDTSDFTGATDIAFNDDLEGAYTDTSKTYATLSTSMKDAFNGKSASNKYYGSWMALTTNGQLHGGVKLAVATDNGNTYAKLGVLRYARAVAGIKKDSYYTVSFKAKAFGTTTELKYGFAPLDTAGALIINNTALGNSFTVTNEWQEYSFGLFATQSEIHYLKLYGDSIGIDDIAIVESEPESVPVPMGVNVIGFYNNVNGGGKDSGAPCASAYDTSDFTGATDIAFNDDLDGAYTDTSKTYATLSTSMKDAFNGKSASNKYYGSWMALTSSNQIHGGVKLAVATDNGNTYAKLGVLRYARAVAGIKKDSYYNVSFKAKAFGTTTELKYGFAPLDTAGALLSNNAAFSKKATVTTEWKEYSFKLKAGSDAIHYLKFFGDSIGIDDISVVEVLPSPVPVPLNTNIVGFYNAATGDGALSSDPVPSVYDTSDFEDVSDIAFNDDLEGAYTDTSKTYATLSTTMQDAFNGKSSTNNYYGSWLSLTKAGQLHGGAKLAVETDNGNTYAKLGVLRYARAVAEIKSGIYYEISFKAKAASATTLKYDFEPLDANGVLGAADSDLSHTSEITTDWKEYSFTMVAESSAMHYLKFYGPDVLIDDISIVGKEAFYVNANVSAGCEDYGFVSPAITPFFESDFVQGTTKATLTATANTGATFVGWYDATSGGTKLSGDKTFDYYPQSATDVTVYARFESKNILGSKKATCADDTSGFETSPTDKNALRMPILSGDSPKGTGNIPASSLENTINAFKTGDKYYGKWFIQNIKDGAATYSYTDSYEFLQVVKNPLQNSTLNSSAQVLKLSNSRHFVRRVDGLKKDHKYMVSFQYYIPFSSTPLSAADLTVGIELDEKTYFNANNPAEISCFENGAWATVSFVYNHTSIQESGYLRFARGSSGSAAYIDNIVVLDVTGKEVVTITAKMNAEHKAFGNIAAEKISAVKGEEVSVFACPFNDYDFKDWTETDKTASLSTEPQYTFKAKEISLVANLNVVNVNISRLRGGKITGASSGIYNIGKNLTVKAIASYGNTFAGWYDESTDTLLSAEEEYTFTVSKEISIIAKFAGDNVEPIDILDLNGFETDKTGTWNYYYSAKDLYDEDWIKEKIVTDKSFTGNKSLQIMAPLRESILTLPAVSKDTDYVLSFYYWIPKTPSPTGDTPKPIEPNLVNAYVSASKYAVAEGAENLAKVGLSPAGTSGWHKVTLKFNSGENTKLYLGMLFNSDLQAFNLDDITLVEYAANQEVINGDFANSTVAWKGDFTVNNGEAIIATGKTIYQYVNVVSDFEYRLSYRVKAEQGGSLLGGIYNAMGDTNVTDQITSYSYDIATNTVWENHSVTVFTAENEFVKLAFKNTGSDVVYLDDVTFNLEAGAANGIVENIDFERERYTISGEEQQSAFEIVDDAQKGKVLMYKKSAGQKALSQAWTRLPLSSKAAYMYTLTLDVKTANGNKLVVLPDKHQNLFKEQDCIVTAKDDGWQEVEYSFVNSNQYAVLDMLIKSITDTNSDVYLDNISLKVKTAFISNTKPDLYTPNLYNLFENPDFEDEFTANDWLDLFDESQVITGDAASLKRFVKLNAGQKIVVPISITSGKFLTFAFFAKAFNGGKGTVTLSTDRLGKVTFADMNGSQESVNSISAEKWQRFGYEISTGSYEKLYVTIECTKGTMGIDLLSLFEAKYAYKENPNNYERPKPFDYEAFINSKDEEPETDSGNAGDSLESESIPMPEEDEEVIEQEENITEQTDDITEAPATGDRTPAVVALLIGMMMICFATLMLSRRKEEM